MLDSGLLSKNFIGRDGFIWWIGQVPDAKFWKGNLPELPQNKVTDLPGFKWRVKVRILGYHTSDLTLLPDDDLPWALVMLPTTSGSGSGANSVTPRFSGGEFVFGFFLDGDNGQQPVIIGTLGNSSQTLLSSSLPSVGFKPFSGFTSSQKQIPAYSIRSPEETKKESVKGEGTVQTGSSGDQPNVKTSSSTLLNPPNIEGSNSTGDLKDANTNAQQQDNPTYPLANACKKGKKKEGIKGALERLVKSLEGIQKINDSYISPTLNAVSDVTAEIELCAGIISGYLKQILNNVRADILLEIEKRIKLLTSKLSTKKQIVAGEAQQKAVDAIGCAFNKIIDALFDLVKNFLENLIDKIINVAVCVIDNMIAALLNSIIGPLEDAISSALGPLSDLISGVTGGVSQALSFVSAIKNLLSCEVEDACPEVNTWSWLDGPKPGTEDDYSNSLSKISKSASSGLSEFLGNPPVSGISGDGNIANCFTGLSNCGPPTIQFFGGTGGGLGETISATANAVIGANGEILAVDLLSSGLNYYSNPFVYFDDPCGSGAGAKAKAIVDCGKVTSVKIIDGGSKYKDKKDGSKGQNGKTKVGIGTTNSNAILYPKGKPDNIDDKSFGFDEITKSTGIATSVQCKFILETENTVGLDTSSIGGYNGPGIYLDLLNVTTEKFTKNTKVVEFTVTKESVFDNTIKIPGSKNNQIIEVSVPKKKNTTSAAFKVGKIYGPIKIDGPGSLHIGNQVVEGINNSGSLTNSSIVVAHDGDDWNDFVLTADFGLFNYYSAPPASIVDNTQVNQNSAVKAYLEVGKIPEPVNKFTTKVNINFSLDLDTGDKSVKSAKIPLAGKKISAQFFPEFGKEYEYTFYENKKYGPITFEGGEGVSLKILDDGKTLAILDGTDDNKDFNIKIDKATSQYSVDNTLASTGIATTSPSKPKPPCPTTKKSKISLPQELLPGQDVETPPNSSVEFSKTMENVILDNSFVKEDTTYTFPDGANFTVPGPVVSTGDSGSQTILEITSDSSVIDKYNVVLELDEIIVENTGVNYSQNDTICIEPDNGAVLKPSFDAFGRLVDVKILNKGGFVTSRPSLSICNSSTGINAQMFAVLSAKKVTKDDVEKYNLNEDQIISVVDCVGKVNG